MSHPESSHRGGHGALWVLPGTHPGDDPPRQDGEPSKRHLVLCVIASACVVVLLCGRHVRGETCQFPTHSLDRAHVSWGSGDLKSTSATWHLHVRIHVGSTEPRSRENVTLLGHTEPFTCNINSQSQSQSRV